MGKRRLAPPLFNMWVGSYETNRLWSMSSLASSCSITKPAYASNSPSSNSCKSSSVDSLELTSTVVFLSNSTYAATVCLAVDILSYSCLLTIYGSEGALSLTMTFLSPVGPFFPFTGPLLVLTGPFLPFLAVILPVFVYALYGSLPQIPILYFS